MPIDKATARVVSESPGRNESERTGGLERFKLRGSSLHRKGEDSMGCRNLAEAVTHPGGVIATAR
jgi:hypothetical protein